MTTKKIAIDFANIDNTAGFVDKPVIDNKLLRIDCWEHTKQICETMCVPPLSIREHYDTDFLVVKTNKTSNIHIYDMDTIDCALLFEKPLVLNLSDDEYAGGWVNMGSGAQEESIFRRSNYFQTLTQNLYPINDNE